MPAKPVRCSVCKRLDREAIDARLAAGDTLAVVVADTGLSRSALDRHRHRCGSRAVVPAPVVSGELILPDAEVSPPTPIAVRHVALDAFFDTARASTRSPSDRLAFAAHLTDLAGIRAATITDPRESATVHALLAVSKVIQRQTKFQELVDETSAKLKSECAPLDRARILMTALLGSSHEDRAWANQKLVELAEEPDPEWTRPSQT